MLQVPSTPSLQLPAPCSACTQLCESSSLTRVAAEQEKQAQVRAREAQMKEDDDSDGINFSDEDSDEEDEATRLARLAQS